MPGCLDGSLHGCLDGRLGYRLGPHRRPLPTVRRLTSSPWVAGAAIRGFYGWKSGHNTWSPDDTLVVVLRELAHLAFLCRIFIFDVVVVSRCFLCLMARFYFSCVPRG